MTKLIVLSLVVLIATKNHAQTPIPNDVNQYQMVQYQPNVNGHYLVTPLKLVNSLDDTTNAKPSLCIINEKGELVWYYRPAYNSCMDLNYYDSLGLFSFQEIRYGAKNRSIVLDTLFLPVDTFLTFQQRPDNHEFRVVNSNSFIQSTRIDSIADLSTYTFNGNPGPNQATLIGYGIQEFDSLKNLVFEWNSNDHVAPDEMVDGFNNFADPNSFDYAHGNSIDKDPAGNYYVSLRHTNCVYKIGPSGQILWRLGGENSDFTFLNDAGFSGQHDARWINDNTISLFDNSNTHTPHLTRGVEYLLDTITWTATKINEFYHPDSLYARAMGSYQICDDQTRILNLGFIFRPNPSLVHLDETNQLVSETLFEDSVVSYRGKFFPGGVSGLSSRPSITCADSSNGKVLSISSSYSSYLWSTGEISPSIFVTNDGSYQCWVNHGIGSIGSEVLNIAINDNCGTVSINEKSPETSRNKIIGYYNILGQKVEHLSNNNFYIVIYEGGFAEKRFYQTP